jgi:acyl-coenzyme A thioesterase PaaI-like protein
MTTHETGAGRMQGAFTESMGDLISYRYVGCQAELIDSDHAVSETALRSHLNTPGSVSAAALAISMLDAAGIAVDRVQLLGLTEIDLQLYEPALDIDRLRTFGTVVRWARSQVFTECRFEDAARPGHVLGVGAANWSVLAPTPDGFEYTDPGPGYPEGPETVSMREAFTIEPRPEGGFVVPELSTTVGSEVLHHGPMLVGLEHAVLEVAAAAAGTDRLALASWTMRIVRAGRKAPFPVSAEVLAVRDDVVGCRAELTDGDGAVVALAHVTFRH